MFSQLVAFVCAELRQAVLPTGWWLSQFHAGDAASDRCRESQSIVVVYCTYGGWLAQGGALTRLMEHVGKILFRQVVRRDLRAYFLYQRPSPTTIPRHLLHHVPHGYWYIFPQLLRQTSRVGRVSNRVYQLG